MKIITILLLTLSLTISGCSHIAPQYEVSMENVQKLKRSGNSKVKVGSFVAQAGKKNELNELTFRGGSFSSPVNGSYAQYIKKAIKKELYLANRYSENADIDISSVLLKNEFDGSGTNIGLASISAEFIVRKNDETKYKKTISVDHEWESYFAAFSALPAAKQGYVQLIKKFISKLFTDKDFLRAIN